MNIAAIIEAARKTGFMHHCQAVEVRKFNGDKWKVTLLEHDGQASSSVSPHGAGGTPEGALADVSQRIAVYGQNKLDRLKSEQGDLVTALAAVRSPPTT